MSQDIYQPPKSDLGREDPKSLTVIDALRWIALVPSIIVSWVIAVLIGGMLLISDSQFEGFANIPSSLLLGGMSAIAVIMVGYAVAPRAKYWVAIYCYVAGALICLLIIIAHLLDRALTPFVYCAISAIIVGGLNILFLKWKQHKADFKAVRRSARGSKSVQS